MRATTPDAETPEYDPHEPAEPGDPIATMLADLYTAATDAEAAVLDELTRRTRYVWVCGEEACGGWRNPGHAAACGSCGTPRPERDATTPEDPHARHGHIENQAVAWNSDLAQVALFAPPHGSAFVLFAHADLRPRLCQFTNAWKRVSCSSESSDAGRPATSSKRCSAIDPSTPDTGAPRDIPPRNPGYVFTCRHCGKPHPARKP